MLWLAETPEDAQYQNVEMIELLGVKVAAAVELEGVVAPCGSVGKRSGEHSRTSCFCLPFDAIAGAAEGAAGGWSR